jgi:hypothetical protein
MAARSKEWVCGSWFAGIAGSNSTGGIVVCSEGCVLLGSGLCDGPIPRQEESCRVPLCVCVCVCVCH